MRLAEMDSRRCSPCRLPTPLGSSSVLGRGKRVSQGARGLLLSIASTSRSSTHRHSQTYLDFEPKENGQSGLEVLGHQHVEARLRDRRQRIQVVPRVRGRDCPSPLVRVLGRGRRPPREAVGWERSRASAALLLMLLLMLPLLLALELPLPEPGEDEELCLHLPARRVRDGHAGEEDAAEGPVDEAEELAVRAVVGRDAAEGELQPAQQLKMPVHHLQVRDEVRVGPARHTKEGHLPVEVRQQGLDRSACALALLQQLLGCACVLYVGLYLYVPQKRM